MKPPAAPLWLAFASTAERRRCSPAGFSRRLAARIGRPVLPLQVGLRAAALETAIGRDVAAAGLISAGLAGGLDPALPAGSLLLPAAVRLADGRLLAVDPAWHARLLASLGPGFELSIAPLTDSATVVADPSDKARLFRTTGAVAVDMESAVLAGWAAARGLPFVVIRVIMDSACTQLPDWTRLALRPDGGTAIGPVLRALSHRPAGLLQLPGIAAQFGAAARSWRRAAEALGCALDPQG